MKRPEPKAVESTGAIRFWLLFLNAMGTGFISAFLPFPSDVRSVVFKVSDQVPGGPHAVGYLFMTMAMLLLIARLTSSRFSRIVHAACAGVYALFAVTLTLTIFVGEYYTAASAFHLAVIAWVHFDAGTEQEPLIKESDDG